MRTTRSAGRCARRSAIAAAGRSWSRPPRPWVSGCSCRASAIPRRTGSAGLSDLLRAALERGATRVLVGLGGSATVDGGLGMLSGLGARVPGATGEALLGELDLDLAPARALFAGVELSVLHDVDVPLCGPDGAAALFGPQKGLRRSDIKPFDLALERLGEASATTSRSARAPAPRAGSAPRSTRSARTRARAATP